MRLDFLERVNFLESTRTRLWFIMEHSKKRDHDDVPDFQFTNDEIQQLVAMHDLLNREEQRQRQERKELRT